MELVKELQKIAKKKGCAPAQLAISWVKHLSKKDGNPVLIPIPGAVTEARISENAVDVALSEDEVADIESILSKFQVKGGRYGGHLATLMDG